LGDDHLDSITQKHGSGLMNRAFSPDIGLRTHTWDVVPGWYEGAPLAPFQISRIRISDFSGNRASRNEPGQETGAPARILSKDTASGRAGGRRSVGGAQDRKNFSRCGLISARSFR